MRITWIFLLILSIGYTGCRNNHTETAPAEGGHAHGEGSVPYTAWSDSCEYFAELTPLVKGQPAEASVHITRLRDHKPFSEGIMEIRVMQNGALIGKGETNKPRIPGIFPVKFSPEKAGMATIVFVFSGGGLKDSVMIPQAMVYKNEEEHQNAPAAENPSGIIRFTKEMAWKTDFQVIQVIPREFSHTIRCSGELFVPPSGIATVTANSDGILSYRRTDLVAGARVDKGEILFTLSGQGLTSRNMEAIVAGMKSRFEASKAAYEREKALVAEQIISKKQFNETILRYQVDSVQYYNYLSGLSGNVINITSPVSGYVQQLHQPNGAFVAEGNELISLATSGKIMLRVDLPQRNWQELSLIRSASFRPSGSENFVDLDDIGGKLVMKGSAVSAENQFIPVTFEFSNDGSFVPGTFADLFLKTTPAYDQLVIPVSSLMEEQGNYYVYVQVAGESYLKRTVRPGFMDGESTTIVSGLTAGERVVSRGAIFIKAASQMTGTPSHGHEH